MSNYISQYEQIISAHQQAFNKNDAIRSFSNITHDNGNKVSNETAHKIYNTVRKYKGDAGRHK